MATRPAQSKGRSSVPPGVWVGLAVLVIGLAMMWALPDTRTIIGSGLVLGAALVAVLKVLRRRPTPGEEHEEAAPLHLRD